MVLSSLLKQPPLSPAETWLIEMCFVLARANKRLNLNKAGPWVRWEMEKQSVHPGLTHPSASNFGFPSHLLCLEQLQAGGRGLTGNLLPCRCSTLWSTFFFNSIKDFFFFFGKEEMSSNPSKCCYKVLGALSLNRSFICKVIWIISANYQEN